MQQVKRAQNPTQNQLERFTEAIESGRFASIIQMLNSLKPQDIAHLIQSSPPKIRQMIWHFLDQQYEGEVLQYLSEDIQTDFLEKMDVGQVIAITEGFESDDLADILQNLPEKIIHEVMDSMSEQNLSRLEQVINYPEDCAGGLMSTDIVTIRASITLDVVARYLRQFEALPEATDSLFVVNRKGEFVGILPLATILVSTPSMTVREVMLTNANTVPVDMKQKDVSLLFTRNDWVSAPVISNQGLLLGRITIDDVVDVIREEADHNILSMAGLSDEEDTFATVTKTAPKRNTWLAINLATAILASLVIKIFESTIEQVVAVAVLMPIVASMGGIAGSQTLTVVIRGISLRQIGKNNFIWLFKRELIVGIANGLIWSSLVGIATYLLYHDIRLSMIIACAMMINLIMAATIATLLPSILKSLSIDPALAGSVILTTFTDIIGFFTFLGLASWLFL